MLLSDLPEHCDRLKANIVLNELGSCVQARLLPWGAWMLCTRRFRLPVIF
jgi:hypothetical protein